MPGGRESIPTRPLLRHSAEVRRRAAAADGKCSADASQPVPRTCDLARIWHDTKGLGRQAGHGCGPRVGGPDWASFKQ